MNRFAIAALVATAGTLVATGTASAQSFNVDLGVQAGQGSGAISAGFAACGTTGSWNMLSATTSQNFHLVNTAGASTGVTLTRPAGATATVPAGNADTGDFGAMMADGFPVNAATDTDFYTFNGLAEGRYLVYVYFANTASGIGAAVDVTGFAGQSMQLAGGSTANKFKAGANYTLSLGDVSPNGQLPLAVTRMNGGQATVAGFQLVKLGGPRKIIQVSQTGAGDRSGSSWANAMPGVVEPMQLLNGAYGYETATTDSAVDLDMWIAGGNYLVTPAGFTGRDYRLSILDGMSMYGGFAGNETHIAQRTTGHETVINGEIGVAGPADNSRKLAEYIQCSDRTITDGVTFANAADERVSVSLFQGRGGAVMITETNSPSGDNGPVFSNVVFRNNLAGSEGGAVYIHAAGVTFKDCSFRNNSTLVTNNDALGGAVSDHGGRSVFLYTDFIQNSGKKGSAIYVDHSGTAFNACRFLGNTGSYSTIHILNGIETVIGNSLIAGNTNALNAAAIYCQGENADLKLQNTTVAHNSAFGSAAGVLLRDGADATVLNSIIWGNTASLPNPGFEGEASIDVVNGPTFVAFARSTVQNGSTMEVAFNAAPYENNSLNPLFIDINGTDNILGNADDNYRLAAGSPSLDSGDITFAPTDFYDLDGDGIIFEETPFDLDGNTRIVDLPAVGVGGFATAIDRGAYEAFIPCHADLNDDGLLDFFDVLAFLQAFASGNMLADFAADGTLDFFDVAEFLNQFAAGCP